MTEVSMTFVGFNERSYLKICILKHQLKLLVILVVLAQISWCQAKTDFETKIKWEDGQLVIPDKTISVSSGVSRYDEDLEALSKVGRVEEIGGYNPHNCVEYAKHRGLWLSHYGLATNYPTNSDKPEIGGFVETYEGGGHMAVVVAMTMNTITIQESNYRTSNTERVLRKDYPLIKGYIN